MAKSEYKYDLGLTKENWINAFLERRFAKFASDLPFIMYNCPGTKIYIRKQTYKDIIEVINDAMNIIKQNYEISNYDKEVPQRDLYNILLDMKSFIFKTNLFRTKYYIDLISYDVYFSSWSVRKLRNVSVFLAKSLYSIEQSALIRLGKK